MTGADGAPDRADGPEVEDSPVARGPAPGLTRFTIEGRTAPALFVVGWLATLVGLGILVIGFLAGDGTAGTLLFIGGAAGTLIGLCALAGSQAIERRAAGGWPYAGPSPALVFIATIPATYLAVVVVGAPLEAVGASFPRPAVELLLVALQAAVTLWLVRLLVVGTGALSWREIGFRRGAASALTDLGWGAVLAGPVILVTVVVAALLSTLVGQVPENPLPPTGTAGGLVLHLLAGAAIAPLAEEVLFRGVAVTAWARLAGAPSAIVRSSVMFALAHVLLVGGETLGEAAGLFAVGLVGRLPVAVALAWTYLRRGSIWSVLGLHAAFNAVLIAVAELGLGG